MCVAKCIFTSRRCLVPAKPLRDEAHEEGGEHAPHREDGHREGPKGGESSMGNGYLVPVEPCWVVVLFDYLREGHKQDTT